MEGESALFIDIRHPSDFFSSGPLCPVVVHCLIIALGHLVPSLCQIVNRKE